MATRPQTRIAHGLFTWQDGREALEACLRSTAGIVDEVLIADGLISGVDPGGLPMLSDLGWLADADYLPPHVPISAKEWRSLSTACTWLLYQAKRLDCDWLLYIDGDQELHEPGLLRTYLDSYQGDAFPISRVDLDLSRGQGIRRACPWQLVRVKPFTRYIAGCFVIEHEHFGEMSLAPEGMPELAPADAPWISHHPERRPPHRQAHRLGNLETVLEPPPHVPQVKLYDLAPLAAA